MKHVDIASLQSGMKLDSVYLVRDVMKRNKKTGEPYVFLNLQDATGTLNAVMWERAELFLSNQARPGDFVHLKGDINRYNNQLQLTIREADKVSSDIVDLEKFLPTSRRPLPEMRRELEEWIGRVKTPHLRALLDDFFGDDRFLTTFLRAPAARTMHQAYVGGLVEHTLGVVKNALSIARNYEGVNEDILITGALIHDGSKVVEYSYQTVIQFTTPGRLVGHLCLMTIEIEKRAARIPDFPEQDKMLLQHMILSHHGRREWGSPKLPMTAEALILFYADYIDAYLSTYFEQQKKAHEKGDEWTEWVDMFESFLYAGLPEQDSEGQTDPSREA